MPTEKQINDGLEVLKQHVIKFEEKFYRLNKDGEKVFVQPKNHDWRPYRWCSRDIVFALNVVKHCTRSNLLEADVCLMASPEQYIDNSGAMVTLGFLLSEAFKCGGSMGIAFTKNVEGGRVPEYICDYVIDEDIKLNHVFEGQITPYEARQLYFSLVGFSESVKKNIMKLSVDKKTSPERICFLVMGGVWSLAEAESIFLSSKYPERIFTSATLPGERQLYLADLYLARQAVLGGTLDRKLSHVDLIENGEIVVSEDIETPFKVEFVAKGFVKVYRTEVKILIPWLPQKKMSLTPDQKMAVLIRAGNEMEIRKYLLDEVEEVLKVANRFKNEGKLVFVLTTRDFDDLEDAIKKQIITTLESNDVNLMIAPDTTSSLDREVVRRLETGKTVRQ